MCIRDSMRHMRRPCCFASKTEISWKNPGATRISFALNIKRANIWRNSRREASVEIVKLYTRSTS
eukprot:12633766-Alexandrium_andersonii.AAC.1